jgi:hypothetical protein
VDHRLGGRAQFVARYSLYDSGAVNSRGAGGLSAPSASQSLDNLDQSLALSGTLTISPHTVLEARAQVAHGDLAAPPADPAGPAVSIAGVAAFGRLASSPTARRNTLLQAIANLSHHAGAHALRAGVDVLYNDDTIAFPRADRGSYVFPSREAFLDGIYGNAGFTQTFGDSAVRQSNPNAGLFAQDEWKLRDDLTVNAGVRYELQSLETIELDRNNIAPRLGVTWSAFRPRRTVLRAGAGLYYDRIPLRPLANALLSAGNTADPAHLRQLVVALSPGQSGAPVFPGVLPAPVAGVTLPTLTTMDRTIDNPYSRQAALEVEQEIGAHTTLAVGYQHVDGRGLLMSVNQNVPACAPAGTNNGCRPDSRYGNHNRYSSVGRSSYRGLHVAVSRQPTRGGHYRVSYTLAKALNNVGEFFFSSPIDPFDLDRDWGRADGDRRHRLVVYGAWVVPASDDRPLWQRPWRGVELSGVLQAYSAAPFNVVSGATTVQGTAGRPVVNGAFIPRNAGAGSAFVNLSARASRELRVGARVKLHVVVEGFNLTNHVNVLTRNTVFGTGPYPGSPLPSFGRITAVGEPRAFQLGLRVRF